MMLMPQPGFFVFLLCEKQVDGRLCAAAFVQIES